MNLQPSDIHGRQTRYTCSLGGGKITLPGYKDEPVVFTCYSCATKVGPNGLPGNTVVDCSGKEKKHLALVHTRDGRSNKLCVASESDRLPIKMRLERDHQWYKNCAGLQGSEGAPAESSTIGQAAFFNQPSRCFEWESSTEVPPTTPASALRTQDLGRHSRPTLQARSFDHDPNDAANFPYYPPGSNPQYQNIAPFPDPLTDDNGFPVFHGSDTVPLHQEYQTGHWNLQGSSVYPPGSAPTLPQASYPTAQYTSPPVDTHNTSQTTTHHQTAHHQQFSQTIPNFKEFERITSKWNDM